MPASARAKTAHWAPLGPKTRPFRHGLGGGEGETDPPLPRGTVVAGCYRIDDLIGQGGMGQVYAAEQLRLGTRVALKLLRRGRTDSENAARLRQEAKAASRIGHRAIVQVVDFDRTSDGLVYLAMELLRGESFEDWLERPGSMLDGVRWLAEAARGLDAAHNAGIVHRDVKPDNVFLHRLADGEVQPKLLDFGLAKATAADLTQVETQAGTLLGTPYYLAPERALGRPLDPRADLYSLGIMLYETLTGNVPFVDDSFMGILALHIKSMPLDPRQAAPDRQLPDTLCRVTMALLAKDPRDRPASGAVVAELLEEVVAQHAASLATIKTGPREVSGPGDETTNLETIAERPTAAPHVPSQPQSPVEPFAATLAPDADAAQVPESTGTARRPRPTRRDGSGEAATLIAGSAQGATLIAGSGALNAQAGAAAPASREAATAVPLPARDSSSRRTGRGWLLVGGGLAAVVAGGALTMVLAPSDPEPASTETRQTETRQTETRQTDVDPVVSPAVRDSAARTRTHPAAVNDAPPRGTVADVHSEADVKPPSAPLAPHDSGTKASETKPPAKAKAGAPRKKRKLPRHPPAHADDPPHDPPASDDASPPKTGMPEFKDFD